MPFLVYNIDMEREIKLIERLRAVGNSDNAEAIYNYYKDNGKLAELYKLMQIWGDENELYPIQS